MTKLLPNTERPVQRVRPKVFWLGIVLTFTTSLLVLADLEYRAGWLTEAFVAWKGFGGERFGWDELVYGLCLVFFESPVGLFTLIPVTVLAVALVIRAKSRRRMLH